MRCYMGHFGEANSTSPEDIMAKISDVELFISSNNMAIRDLNEEIDELQKQISGIENNELKAVDGIIEKILALGRTADSRKKDYFESLKNLSLSW